MNDERHNERLDEREIERDSQLSAMFDGELSAGECELIARRLARDEALRDRVAWRVQSVISQEPTYGDGTDIGASNARTAAVVPAEVLRRAASRRWVQFTRPLAGAGIAASVAAAAILFLRFQGDTPELVADNAAVPESIALTPAASPVVVQQEPARISAVIAASGEPDRYVTPQPNSSASIAPPASLANYVVAHSEYSGPISRRMALLGVLASENGAGVAQPEAEPATEPNDAP
jgi:sigma-E factor negative regulatory protein RseA